MQWRLVYRVRFQNGPLSWCQASGSDRDMLLANDLRGKTMPECNVHALTITDKHPEGDKYETNTTKQFSLPWNDDTETEKPGLSEVLQVEEGTDNEWPLKLREFAIEQANDQYCKKVASTVGGRATYSYVRNGVLIRQSQIDGEVQKVAVISLCRRVLHSSHYPVLAGIEARDNVLTRCEQNVRGPTRPMKLIKQYLICGLAQRTAREPTVKRN